MESELAERGRLQDLPAEVADAVEQCIERLGDRAADLSDEQAERLVRLVAASDFAASALLRAADGLPDWASRFDAPFDFTSLSELADRILLGEFAVEEIQSILRRERDRALLHLLWRDIAGLADLEQSQVSWSQVADQLLRAAAGYAATKIEERFGKLRDRDGNAVPFVILAMGKLGGGELNYSSDVDVIFLYPSDGESDGARSLPAQPYFDRLSRQIIALIDEVTADGFAFRTDTRLRPFGDSGPPVVSFAALESYLQQHGRDWERYAYVKARIVGVRPEPEVVEELIDRLVTPFVYRRYLDYGVFESLREMHAMIAAEVQRRELADNVKLGPGGIREIEFIVQSLQLVRGGRRRELRTTSLLEALPRLAEQRGFDAESAQLLSDAYRFLRRVENYIQAGYDKQTHELPKTELDRARLCVAMGFDDWPALLDALERHRNVVSDQFERVAFRDRGTGEVQETRHLAELWAADAEVDRWRSELEELGFGAAAELADLVVEFRRAAGTRKADRAAEERLQAFIPQLLMAAKNCEHPDTALGRCFTVIEQILRRSAYLALLNENQAAAMRFVRLCERSAYISRQLARYPLLLDELLDSAVLSDAIPKAELEAERSARLGDESDLETRMELLAHFQRAIMFRVAVADFSGDLPIMKVSDSLTWLAETVLDEALDSAWNDLTARHGVPHCIVDGNRRTAGFGIIAYGKLGGLELSYGSDLDIVFLHDSAGSEQQTDGDRPLDNAVFFSRLIRRLVHFLTTQTSAGALYEIDTRLRPSGRKGLLVTSVDAFRRYQDENAWTWEHQALLRARAVAGDKIVLGAFEQIRAEVLRTTIRLDRLRDDVISMRAKMRDELDRSGAETFDLKHGRGGIGDIEFIVQFLVLANAAREPALIEYSDNIRQLDALAACGVVTAEEAEGMQRVYRHYRRRQHHLALETAAPLLPASEFGSERDAVLDLWERTFQERSQD